MPRPFPQPRAVALLAVAAVLALLALLALPPPRRTPGPPRVTSVRRFDPGATWTAGAAELPLPVGPGTHLAGYGPFRNARGVRDTPMARAAVIGPVALLALDLVEVSPALASAIRQKLGPDTPELFAAATHTHSGPGGTDPNPLAQLLGEGRFDEARLDAFAETAAEAVRRARAAARPASLRLARVARPDLQEERDRCGTPDSTLAVLEAVAIGGEPVATVVVFGAHPTLLPGGERLVSADWPGAAARALEARGGVALVLQGAGGDATVPRARLPKAPGARIEAYGRAFASAVEGALATATPVPPGPSAIATAATALPALDLAPVLGPFHRLPDRLLGPLAPAATTVTAFAIGSALVLCVPGELTGAARRLLPEAPLVVSLCNGDVSYVEAPAQWRAGTGERLALFGEGLAPTLAAAARTALAALPR